MHVPLVDVNWQSLDLDLVAWYSRQQLVNRDLPTVMAEHGLPWPHKEQASDCEAASTFAGLILRRPSPQVRSSKPSPRVKLSGKSKSQFHQVMPVPSSVKVLQSRTEWTVGTP